MTTLSERPPSAATLALQGDVDLAADVIRAAAEEAIDAGCATLSLDLAEVTFIDSQGLKAILEARQSLRDAGAALVLEHPPVAVRRLLSITSLDGLLDVREPTGS